MLPEVEHHEHEAKDVGEGEDEPHAPEELAGLAHEACGEEAWETPGRRGDIRVDEPLLGLYSGL